jgi:hypothetical protein
MVECPRRDRPPLEGVLRARHHYALVVRIPHDIDLRVFALRQGSSEGFTSASYFAQGRALLCDGNICEGWPYRRSPSTEADLSFYFAPVTPGP